jgi:membrane protease YdiL (CAAX protease family)
VERESQTEEIVAGESGERRHRPSLARRVVMFPLVRVFLGVLLIALVMVGVQIGVRAVHGNGGGPAPMTSVDGAVLVAVATLAAYALFVRWLERRRVDELVMAKAPRDVAAGAGLGIGVMGLTIAAIWALGGYSVGGSNGAGALVAPLALAVASGFSEEVLFRGVIYRITEGSLGTWAALVITSALFGAAHLANKNATLWGAFAIALEAGVLLGAAYTASRGLWLPIGLHVGWNFAEAGLVGATVSGANVRGLVTARFDGPDWLTGGAFGPEASVPAVTVCLAVAVVLLALAASRGRISPPGWARRRKASRTP